MEVNLKNRDNTEGITKRRKNRDKNRDNEQGGEAGKIQQEKNWIIHKGKQSRERIGDKTRDKK